MDGHRKESYRFLFTHLYPNSTGIKKAYDSDCFIIGTVVDFEYAQAIIDEGDFRVENIWWNTEPADFIYV